MSEDSKEAVKEAKKRLQGRHGSAIDDRRVNTAEKKDKKIKRLERENRYLASKVDNLEEELESLKETVDNIKRYQVNGWTG